MIGGGRRWVAKVATVDCWRHAVALFLGFATARVSVWCLGLTRLAVRSAAGAAQILV